MKNKSNFYLGIFFIGLGLIFLLRNLGYVHVSMASIFRLWPFLFIIMGLRYIPMKPKVRDWVNILLLVAFFGLLFFGPQVQWRKALFGIFPLNVYYNSHESDEETDSDTSFSVTAPATSDKNDLYFSAEMSPAIKEARMEINIAEIDFHVKKPTSKLYELILEDVPYNLKSYFSMDGDKALIRIKPEEENNHHRLSDMAMGELRLNDAIPWDLEINTGASALDLDFSPYIISSLKINTAASKVDLKLGKHTAAAQVEISSGASGLNLQVPKDSGIEVEINHVFSSKSLPGFKKVKKNTYRSENFDASKSKIFIRITSAVSQLRITRY